MRRPYVIRMREEKNTHALMFPEAVDGDGSLRKEFMDTIQSIDTAMQRSKPSGVGCKIKVIPNKCPANKMVYDRRRVGIYDTLIKYTVHG